MIEHLRRLFTYDDWANREVLASLRKAGASSPRSLDLFGHLLSSEKLWFERLNHQPQTWPVWPQFDLAQCEAELAQLLPHWQNFLDRTGEAGLNQTITYKNTLGEAFSSRVEDVLLHVITHSTYHRGQIAVSMRASGHTPAYTDFIHSVRQGFIE